MTQDWYSPARMHFDAIDDKRPHEDHEHRHEMTCDGVYKRQPPAERSTTYFDHDMPSGLRIHNTSWPNKKEESQQLSRLLPSRLARRLELNCLHPRRPAHIVFHLGGRGSQNPRLGSPTSPGCLPLLRTVFFRHVPRPEREPCPTANARTMS